MIVDFIFYATYLTNIVLGFIAIVAFFALFGSKEKLESFIYIFFILLFALSIYGHMKTGDIREDRIIQAYSQKVEKERAAEKKALEIAQQKKIDELYSSLMNLTGTNKEQAKNIVEKLELVGLKGIATVNKFTLEDNMYKVWPGQGSGIRQVYFKLDANKKVSYIGINTNLGYQPLFENGKLLHKAAEYTLSPKDYDMYSDEVKEFMLSKMKDPYSAEIIEQYLEKRANIIYAEGKIRGKNSFGAYVVNSYNVTINLNSNTISLDSME